MRFSRIMKSAAIGLTAATGLAAASASNAVAQEKKPNIIVIMGDDVGWENIGAYHQGLMYNTTPNLDKLASEGMRFTDYYAEPSCTAGRANFITGELPIRTGLTTVGQAGAKIGMPDEAPTIATALKTLGYETGQFGKNHLGDLNQYLPTMHGFDEFWGYLYHLDAMEDPFWHSYPPALKDTVGPRNLIHSFATDVDDATVEPRWGKIGKQKIVDEGPLPPHPMPGIKYNMETVDEDILDHTLEVHRQGGEGRQALLRLDEPHPRPCDLASLAEIRRGADAGKPVVSGRRRDEAARRRRRRGDGQAEGRRARQQHHRRLHHRQRHGELHLARRRQHALRRRQGDDLGRRHARADDGPLARPYPRRQGRERHLLGLDFFPTLVALAGEPGIKEDLLKGKQLGDKTYKVHLDGYDQTNVLTGKGPSNRHEVFYFAEGTLGAVRLDDIKFRMIDQPDGWLGGTVHLDWPILTNLRLDPFERLGFAKGNTGSFEYIDFFEHEFWRFVFLQQKVGEYAQTFVEYPPMQRGASFNLEAVKAQIEEEVKAMKGKME